MIKEKFFKKNGQNVCRLKKKHYLCTRKAKENALYLMVEKFLKKSPQKFGRLKKKTYLCTIKLNECLTIKSKRRFIYEKSYWNREGD